MSKLENPFLVYGYDGPEYFCDRERETEDLTDALRNGWNITLVAPRRMGKTGLINNVFWHIAHERQDAVCIYVDIFGTNNLHDFVQALGTAMLNAMMSRGRQLLNEVSEFFSSWRPLVSVDPLTGAPSVSVSLEPTHAELDLKAIFDYMKQSDKEIYFAIDEFQQIMYYPEKGTEAQLRSYIQFIHNVHFIFSGSKQHLMTEMFMSPKRPFFQSTRLMDLKPISETPYYAFADGFFKARGGYMKKDVFDYVYDLLEGHTWYIQCIMKVLYEKYNKVDSRKQANAAIEDIIMSNEAYYEHLLSLLSERQQSVVKAFAKEGYVGSPTAGDFIQRYNLKTASSVKSAIDTLTDKEIIYRGVKGYMVYDRFFGMWLRRR